jgi:hypothetical protein
MNGLTVEFLQGHPQHAARASMHTNKLGGSEPRFDVFLETISFAINLQHIFCYCGNTPFG